MSVTLPTPPSSPSATTHNNNSMSQENDALQQLRTLQQYYVNTSQWVTQTRAALFELALAQGAEASTSSSPPLSQQQQPCAPQAPVSPAASDATSAEPDSADVDMRTARANGDDQTGAASSRASLLARRKNGMKLELKLDGIGARRRYRRPAPNTASLAAKQQHHHHHQQPQPAVILPGDHLAHMLQLFGDLVDSRMESCARMERLVRDAAAPMAAW